MDFISTALVTLNEPTGFWETILNAFKIGTGSYIVAVILIALIVRVLFTLVDIVNKKVNMKNSNINAKMKPELEAIQKKYGHDQRLLQQKTNELYKKYQFSMMGSCVPMLITMVLQFTVFLTLWNSLQAVSNYNIANKYENMKNVYANVISLNENEIALSLMQDYQEGDNLELDIDFEQNKLILSLYNQGSDTPDTREIEYKKDWTNEGIYTLLSNYVIPKTETPPDGTVTALEYVQNSGYNDVFKALAEETAEKYYIETQEGFLWIKNIYKAESPTSPLFTKDEITKYLSGFYSEDEKKLEETNGYEGKIFDCVVAGIDSEKLGVNGYYILTILAVATSFLSLFLSNKLMQGKKNPGQKQSKAMYFIMPIIMGIFTFMYTSLFAIYLIVGQLVMMALTPLTTWIVKKWVASDEKKKKEKEEIVVDYRRK